MHSTVLEGGRGGGGECNLVIIIAILCLRTQLVYNVDDSLVLLSYSLLLSNLELGDSCSNLISKLLHSSFPGVISRRIMVLAMQCFHYEFVRGQLYL